MTTDKQARRKRWIQAGGLLLAVALAAVVFTSLRAPAATEPSTGRWIAVQPAPLVHQIGLVGKIEPQKTIILTAPFEGNVQAILVEQGQRVEAGQTLLQMDPGLLEIQLRDALSAQLKARRAVQELQDWNNSQQVARARRTLRSAQMTASNTERKLGESQNLFERGIIPRNELQDLQQQLQSQRMDLSAAEGDLQQALDQGKGEYRQIADMELTNATVKYETLKALLDGKNVVAPFAGIVVPDPRRQRLAELRQQQLGAGTDRQPGQPGPTVVRSGKHRTVEDRQQGFRAGHQPVAPGPERRDPR